MKIILNIITILSLSIGAFAQKIDEERMKRDVEVAENILGTLLQEERHRGFIFETIDGQYVQDFGVIFTIPGHSLIAAPRALKVGGTSYAFTTDDDGDFTIVESDGNGAVTINVPRAEATKVNMDSLVNIKKKKTLQTLTVFLADYGNLINQLTDDQSILVTTGRNDFHFYRSSTSPNQFSVEAKVANIKAYKEGKLSLDEFKEKLSITDKAGVEETSKDLELFSTIMNRLYRQDLSNTYYSSGQIHYDRLTDFGVIYEMKVYSSSGSGDSHTVVTTNQSNLTQAERDAIVKGMYPEFMKVLKENILDYGKTISSLKENEILMFKVELTKCIGCNIPKSVEVSIKNEVLQNYGTGKISKAEALNRFNVREGNLQ